MSLPPNWETMSLDALYSAVNDPNKHHAVDPVPFHDAPPDDVVPPVNGPDDFGVGADREADCDEAAPIQWVDMSVWDREPVPVRQWAIKDRVPLNQAGLFSGEGGVGKSIIELTKDMAHVIGKDWLGSMPEPGP